MLYTDLIFSSITQNQASEIQKLLSQANFSFVETEYGLALDNHATFEDILMIVGKTLFNLIILA